MFGHRLGEFVCGYWVSKGTNSSHSLFSPSFYNFKMSIGIDFLKIILISLSSPLSRREKILAM